MMTDQQEDLEFLRQYANDLEADNHSLRAWAAFWFFMAFVLFAFCGAAVMWAIWLMH